MFTKHFRKQQEKKNLTPLLQLCVHARILNEAFPFIESLLIAIMRMVRKNLLDDDIDEGGPSNQQAANDEDDDDDELDKSISGIEVEDNQTLTTTTLLEVTN